MISTDKQFLNPFPKHLQIREILLRRIERDFRIGDRFPTEKVLCREFRVSRETIREALGWLQREGLISRHRGQGTFVAKRPSHNFDTRLTGFTEDYRDLNIDTEATTIEEGLIISPPDISTDLSDCNGLVYYIKRLRLLDKTSFALHESFLHPKYRSTLITVNLSRSFIVNELERYLGIRLYEDRHQIEAIVADTDEARVFDINIGAPLLRISRYYVDLDGNLVIYSRSSYRADRYYYTVNLNIDNERHAENADQ